MIGQKAIGTVAYLGGVPAVLEEFCYALANVMTFSRETLCNDQQYIHLDRVKYSDHGPARNELVRRMFGDWLLFLDTDHEPEPDLLVRMLDRMTRADLDVLTGLYRFKQPPCSPVLYKTNPDNGLLLPIARYPKDAIFQVDAAGAGCLLIRRGVFDRIAQTGEEPFSRRVGLSEDHSFFRRLEELGIVAACDPRIECPHLRIRQIGESDLADKDYQISDSFSVVAGGV